MTTTKTVIAASPDWQVATFSLDGTEVWYDHIIGWEVIRIESLADGREYTHHYTIPLTADGSPDGQGNLWAIRNPEGEIIFPEDRTCPNEADALAYVAEVIKQTAETKAKMKGVTSV